MSADNGIIIRRNNAGLWRVQEYNASADDYPNLETDPAIPAWHQAPGWSSLEGACRAAAEIEHEFPSEYGITIILEHHEKK